MTKLDAPIVRNNVKKVAFKKIKSEIQKEFNFLKNVFSVLHIPLQMKGSENSEYLTLSKSNDQEPKSTNDRARSIADLEEKLQKIKSEKSFSLKNKYTKKSLVSKLNKKNKKKQRHVKTEKPFSLEQVNNENSQNQNVNVAKPIFNSDGKLVFSKFDFANLGHKEKGNKSQKDPKKILQGLKKQEEKIRHIEETGGAERGNEIKDKQAWKNILKKAEGEKVKDDPVLLKKTIKKMEQKKKQSKKRWDARVTNVEQKVQDRQKKRQENIAKKKKEKRAKIVKTSVKRGRVVI